MKILSINRKPIRLATGFAVLAISSFAARAQDSILVDKGQKWWFLDNGKDPGPGWQSRLTAQPGWQQGRAQLGYGDFDERTWLRYGRNSKAKHITSYFAKSFQVKDRSKFRVLKMRALFDDGAVVYLNGQEIWRFNMPAGKIANNTLASSTVQGAVEDVYFLQRVSTKTLKNGLNILAVEVHQASQASSDLSFDIQVLGSDGGTGLLRGPYLQLATPKSITVRWRTDAAVDSVVWFGKSLSSQKRAARSNKKSFNHELQLDKLEPGTRYYYSIGSTQGRLAGGDATYSFVTAPASGSAKKTRLWVLGDSGTRNLVAEAVRKGYESFAAGRRADAILMLGDNAYVTGRDIEYQDAVFEMYATQLRQTALWPCIGNHDLVSELATGVYSRIFTLPTQAEAGGIPSSSEAYYSFDHGSIHIVCLDSERILGNEKILRWLERDLRATRAQWILAYWHQAPYSKGSHDSDSTPLMSAMREQVLPILESHGVDLVLAGHSHSYERSYLLNGHYGPSSSLRKSMILDAGNGQRGGDGQYRKTAGPFSGTVYVVEGTSGGIVNSKLGHPAMAVSKIELGSLVLDIEGKQLVGQFVDYKGRVRDRFTIEKPSRRILRRSASTISLSKGGSQFLDLDASPAHAGMLYVVAGSFGTSPGFQIGKIHVPLNPDTWFALTLASANSSIFTGFVGVLDRAGLASAEIRVPSNAQLALLGLSVNHAAMVFDRSATPMLSSNWERLRFIK